MSKAARGLPIAAYLGLLVALALACAFIAVLAIVIWLPPRPPDVTRADLLIGEFQAGYTEAVATGAAPANDELAWRIAAAPTRQSALPHLSHTRAQLAERLGLPGESVQIAAAEIARSERFVFRVREFEGRHREHHIEMHRGEADVMSRITIEGGAPFPPPPLPPPPPMFEPAPRGVLLLSGVEISALLPDGRWLIMRQGRNWEALSWIGRAALVLGATLAALSLLAVWFAGRLTRPIRNFADAVGAVGVDPNSAPVREEGPAELRRAATAVNTMQARLRALVADRTKTLATVAHDMRTPLMRLRLAAENVAPEQRERMAKEIGEVEALVASFIAFARDDPAEEARVRVDLAALLQSLSDDAVEAGRDVSYAGEERLIVTGQPLGLKRLFANLIDNAVKYGKRARIRLWRESGAVMVEVADDGPGIPESEREAVFEPFVRLSRSESGAGLGLPAARSIARAHGGDIVVCESAFGAVLQVILPM